MNRCGFTWLVAVAVIVAFASPVFAQATRPSATDMQILADKLKADKKLLVAQTMDLAPDEEKAFWPIYDAYQADLQKINDRTKTVIESYASDYNAGTMTDEKAAALTKEAIAIEESLVSMKKACVAKLTGVIPATKLARYVQIENKIRAQINYELAGAIPFVR